MNELKELIENDTNTLDIDTCLITDMSKLFSDLPIGNHRGLNFNQPLNHWDVSKIIDMYEMFWGATSFNQPLNNWNVSKISKSLRSA